MAISEGVLFGIFAMISYGLADFFAKKAVDKYGPFIALKVSLTSGTLAVLIYSLIFLELPVMPIGTLVFVLIAGIAGAAGWVMFYKGLNAGKVSIVSPIASSWGLIPFVLAIAFLSESLTSTEILSSASILVGIFLISVDWKEFTSTLRKKMYPGAGAAIIAMVGFGLSGFFTKFVVDALGAFYSVVLIRIVSIVLIFVYAEKSRQKARFEGKFILLLIFVGLLDALGYLSFNLGLSVGFVSVVSAIVSAAPSVVLILAYVFFREHIANNQYLGIALIVAGFIGLSIL